MFFFSDKPSSVILSSNASNVQQVPVNSTIMFSCSSDARPTARYIFYRNGKIEQNSPSNIWITPTLNCPSTSAGENFTCVAYNTVGNTSKTQSIMLFGKW